MSVCVCSVSVSEDEVVGTTLLHLSATDDDYTYDNTRLEFNIISTASTGMSTGDDGVRWFRMTESTGELILASSLDRETIDRYELTVTASDHGQPSLTTTTTVSSIVVVVVVVVAVIVVVVVVVV